MLDEARELYFSGQHAEAAMLEESVLEEQRDMLGEEDTKTLATTRALALSLAHLPGERERAIEMLVEVEIPQCTCAISLEWPGGGACRSIIMPWRLELLTWIDSAAASIGG